MIYSYSKLIKVDQELDETRLQNEQLNLLFANIEKSGRKKTYLNDDDNDEASETEYNNGVKTPLERFNAMIPTTTEKKDSILGSRRSSKDASENIICKEETKNELDNFKNVVKNMDVTKAFETFIESSKPENMSNIFLIQTDYENDDNSINYDLNNRVEIIGDETSVNSERMKRSKKINLEPVKEVKCENENENENDFINYSDENEEVIDLDSYNVENVKDIDDKNVEEENNFYTKESLKELEYGEIKDIAKKTFKIKLTNDGRSKNKMTLIKEILEKQNN